MAVNLSPIGNGFQFFSNDGLPLNAGKIYTYQAGSTTPFSTYTDSNGLIANTNPIILGTSGRPPSEIWLTEGYFYKFVLTDSSDVTIQTYDNLYGIIGVAPTPATPTPSGVIVLWSGSIGSIPAGWHLCNGNNGTPDLRDRFIVGAGSTYSVDATGGSANAIVVSHTHTLTIDSAGAHDHSTRASNLSGASLPATADIVLININQTTYGTVDDDVMSTEGTHTHTATIDSAGNSGTNANLPPYYALCYIMKA
jgi:microcystin-dependent protein